MLASYGFSAAVAMAAGTKSVAIVTQKHIHTHGRVDLSCLHLQQPIYDNVEAC